jgi:hypothetical protein
VSTTRPAGRPLLAASGAAIYFLLEDKNPFFIRKQRADVCD